MRHSHSTLRTGVWISFLFSAVMCFAQFSSNIQGIVQDASGGSIPNASVTILNKATNVTQTTRSSESGVYRFSSLPPGQYQVTVEASGFQKTTLNATVETAQTAGLNVT